MKMKKRFLTIFSIGFLTLSACGDDKTSGGGIKEVEFFENVTEFDDPVDMHTDAQKAFLEYDQGYENLTSSYITEHFGCNGNDDFSAPKGVSIAFTHEENSDIHHYVLEVSKDKNFNDGIYTFSGSKTAKSITAYNLEIGQQYYYRIGAFDKNNDLIDYSIKRTLETENIAPRNLKIDGITNCRDLGGRTTLHGGKVKQGLLYRTSALDDTLSNSIITAAGKDVFENQINVKSEIELRGGSKGAGGEYSAHTDNSQLNDKVNYYYIPFAYENGKNLLFRNIEPVRKVFDVLAEPDNYPVFFHCRIGTDRTGLIALLVNALLGIDLQNIFQDYLFSDFGCIGKVPTVGQANEDSIAEYVEELRTFPGETLQESVYNFLRTAGISAAKLDSLINILTESGSPKWEHEKKVEVVTVDKMTTDLNITSVDITKDPNTSTRLPEKYVTFGTNKKITYTFTSDCAFTADLYANLCSKETNGNLNTAFKITVNGAPITVSNTSFAKNKLGFDSNIECWIPSKLGNISVNSGNNTIEIEALKSTSIKFSQFAFSSMSEPANIA